MLDTDLRLEDRLLGVLRHLGIERAHFAGNSKDDYSGLAINHPEAIASLMLTVGRPIDSGTIGALSSRLLVFGGDQGPTGETLERAGLQFPAAKVVTLRDYFQASWSDVIAHRTEEVGDAMMSFLDTVRLEEALPSITLPPGEGEMLEISYRIAGSGPPIVLFPLGFAPSQWEPIIPLLNQRYTSITLGGALLGSVDFLERRADTAFRGLFQSVMYDVGLRPGEAVLDVGCGTGALDRWLAQSTYGANAITAVDANRYLLREAAALARKQGLESIVSFREGSAESLPFPDTSFDVSVSTTVIEEVDAGKMLAEMIRVTKPGGRIAVIARAEDIPVWVNLNVRVDLKAKAEKPGIGGGVGSRGCADASLYRRFHEVGLIPIKRGPRWATFEAPPLLTALHASMLARLDPDEAREWQAAAARAESEGTFFVAFPCHCAVGRKP